jgi:hypothetical protein
LEPLEVEGWEWERLGESSPFGEVLLDLLERHGWHIERRAGFAGAGILLMATRRDVDRALCGEGPTVADAALTLFNEIASQPSLMRAVA